MNKYFLKEWIKLKCDIFYGAGYIAGFSIATWRFWTNDQDEKLEEKRQSAELAQESLQRIIDYINKEKP